MGFIKGSRGTIGFKVEEFGLTGFSNLAPILAW